ncbi:MAG: hypothetical protein WBM84_02845 [Sedimenticolaceae bacterium]
MRFSVFAISSVPDTQAARHLFGLHDLDDTSVSKVLFHHRKQQTGSSEVLRWDQCAIACLTLIQHAGGDVQLNSISLASASERDMLDAFYQAARDVSHMISWGGARYGLPLIHFRSLRHAVSHPEYWRAGREQRDIHLDLRNWLSPSSDDMPALDETARRLGLPGLLETTEDAVIEAWLNGRHESAQAFSELSALNTYLLALRMFGVTGEITRQDHAQAQDQLRAQLGRGEGQHRVEFLSAWSAS